MVTNKEITTLQNGAVANGLVLEITPLVDGQQVGGRPEAQVLVQGIIGSPEGRAIGSPGDIKIRQDAPELWQKITGVRTRTGWIRLHSGGSPSMQNTYVTSGGVDPTIQLTPALGPLSVNGAGGLANILALRRATGVDAFVVAETGDVTAIGSLSLDSASPSSSFGNAAGSPILSLQKSAVGTSTIQYRITTVGNTSGDKRTQHNATEGLVVENYNGASWDTLTTYTTTVTQNVATNFDFAVTMDSTLGVTGAITGASMSVSGNFVGTGAASSMLLGDATASPAAFLQKGAAGTAYVYLRVTTSGFTSTDKRMGMDASERITWENYNGASWDVVLQSTASTLSTLLPFHSGPQTVTGAINATGTIRAGDTSGNVSLVLQKAAANTSDLMARVTTSGNTSGDKRLLHNTSESWIFQNYNGASWDDLTTYTTIVTHNVDVTLEGNDFSMVHASPRVNLGDSAGGGFPVVRAVESATATPPGLEIRGGNHTGVGAGNFDGTTVVIQGGDTTDTGASASPGGVTVRVGTTAGGGAVPAIELEADVHVTGLMSLSANLDLDSASPAAILGNATGSPLILIFKAAASTSQQFWRTSNSGATTGDKAFAHNPSEGLEVRNYNGASWDTLTTFTTFPTFETAVNFDDAVNIDGTVGIGDATDSTLQNFQKSAAGTSYVQFRVTTSGNTANDKRIGHNSTESLEFENYNGASWDVIQRVTGAATFPVSVVMEANVNIEGTFDIGNASDSTIMFQQKSAGGTSQHVFRVTTSGNTSGDKLFIHDTDETLGIWNYNGASWDALATYSTLTTFNSGVAGPGRVNAAGAACAITPTDWFVNVSSNGGGPIVISHTMSAGQSVRIGMSAFDTDAYTMAVVGGTLTLNAVGEAATVMYDGTNVWVTALGTATVV